MNLMLNFKKYALVALLAFLAGFYVGHRVQTGITQSKELKALNTVVEKSKQSVDESTKIELKAADAKEKIEVRYKTITKEIYKYVPETVYGNCTDDTGARVNTTLSSDAVRVLNSTGEDGDFQPTSVSESQAFTEIGLRELSEHIATIKKQYEELAVEHDGLIDYNNYYKGLIGQ